MANIVLRLPNDLHDVARIAAAVRRQSLNAWILEQLRGGIVRAARAKGGEAVAACVNATARAAKQ
jgi:hypothetical protein